MGSIKVKKCKCGCSKYPTISCKGYNYACAPDEIKQMLGEKRKLNQKNKIARMSTASKIRKENNFDRKQSLNEWFSGIAEKHLIEDFRGIGCECLECGEWIPSEYIRHATAHLLPKKLFHSVETHELNYLILGAGCGCHNKTDRLDLFVKMKVWPEAARRIKIILPLLPFEELQFISSQLLAELDKIK